MYYLNSENAIKEMKSSLNGLSEEDARIRLKKHGKNEIEREKKQSIIKSFFF